MVHVGFVLRRGYACLALLGWDSRLATVLTRGLPVVGVLVVTNNLVSSGSCHRPVGPRPPSPNSFAGAAEAMARQAAVRGRVLSRFMQNDSMNGNAMSILSLRYSNRKGRSLLNLRDLAAVVDRFAGDLAGFSENVTSVLRL